VNSTNTGTPPWSAGSSTAPCPPRPSSDCWAWAHRRPCIAFAPGASCSGTAVGNQTWFPAWQFDTDRLRLDLPRILQLLTRFTADPVAADRVMRITHSEPGGHSIAEALRRPETADDAWRMLTAVGA
jgi:hypothetical protein